METIVVLICALASGWVLRRLALINDNGVDAINTILLNVFLPSLILHHLHGVTVSQAFILAIAMPYVLFGVGCAVFLIIGRTIGLSTQDICCLCLTAAIGNSGFVGLPMVDALIGPEGMPAATALDQLGSTVGISVLGTAVANLATSHRTNFACHIVRIVRFPPVIATAVALALNSVAFPVVFNNVLERFAECVAPLALLVVGAQMRLTLQECNYRALIIGLGFKLIAAPAIVLYVMGLLGNPAGTTERVMVLDAAMGTTIAGAMLASRHGLNPRLTAAMVSYSIPLGIVSGILWMYFS